LVLTRSLQCPPQIFSKAGYLQTLSGLIGGSRWALVTSRGWVSRGAVDGLHRALGAPAAVIDAVPENPKLSDLKDLAPAMPEVDAVVALGGGSVIDCAKGIVAYRAIGMNEAELVAHLKDGSALDFDGNAPLPIHAVPTTSGTGSEVTPWGTIWGDDLLKFSVKDPLLYPASAILDPSLCTSMPEWLTVSSGLDAMSHAMEAVWNNNHTPFSDEMARVAIEELWTALPAAVATPQELAARARVQIAASIAGLAMGTTNTALAHSISYPFTAKHGMPHGFACSFTLPGVAAYNMQEDPQRLTPIARGMGCPVDEIPARLQRWMDDLGIAAQLERHVSPDDADAFGDSLITRARAANNLREIDGPAARALARESLESFAGTVEKS
jgi:alcohol dehydrogenase